MFDFVKRAAAVAVVALGSMAFGQAVQVDKSLPEYKPASGISGNLKSVGSDSLNNLMTLWAEEFKKLYPNLNMEIEGKGSSTAPPALIEGAAQLGPMSRPMKSSEIDDFKKKYGYAPAVARVAVDSLGVFVNKDNPIKSLSFEQIQQAFSVAGPESVTWGMLGVEEADWKDKPVSLYGRNSASGTYGFFKEHALGKKDFKASVKEQPGSSAVVQGVAKDKYGIGYSGIGYATADVRAVPLSLKKGEKAFEATAANAYSGDYPLSRFLLVYVNAEPNKGASPLVAEFLKMAQSQAGQQIVVKDGYYPITVQIADEDKKALGLK